MTLHLVINSISNNNKQPKKDEGEGFIQTIHLFEQPFTLKKVKYVLIYKSLR